MQVTESILRLRLAQPELCRTLLEKRQRRVHWEAEKLVLLAIDHPARRVVAAGKNPWAMADRGELLTRVARVLMQPFVNGLLATPDIIEEVLLLNHLVVEAGGPNFIDGKILVGSMNRGGLANTVFELDDVVTGYTPESIAALQLDAGKLLFRLEPDSRDSLRTMQYCVDALNVLEDHNLPCFLEPLTTNGSPDDLVRLVGVASAMGYSSAHRWLKLPMVGDMARVAAATTCPIVLLGGGNPGTTEQLVANVTEALAAGPNVRGLMIGRGVLYPEDDVDPVVVASKLAAAVYEEEQEVVLWDGLKSTHLVG